MIDEYLQDNNSNPTEAVQELEKIFHSIAKDCLAPKSDICIPQNNKSCNKWMNEKCFQAKKDFIKPTGAVIKYARCSIWCRLLNFF